MTSGARIIGAVRALRRDADFTADQADAVGLAAVEAADAAAERIADRLLIRLGAWTLGVVAVATAIIIAAVRLIVG